MKSVRIFAFALVNIVKAALVNNKRDIVYSTTTKEVWETFWTTTTICADPALAVVTPSASYIGGFFEEHSSILTTTSSVVISSSAVLALVPKSSSSSSTSTSAYIAPSPIARTTSAYVAPKLSTTSTQAPAQIITQAATSASLSPIATPTTVTNSGGSAGDHTGDMTYYDVSVGLGSCGKPGSNDQPLVALAEFDMGSYADPNSNPLCGRAINIYYNGVTHKATIHDTCPACASGSIDVTNTLFKSIAPSGDGRVQGVSWSFA
jgi:hypothetical protein